MNKTKIDWADYTWNPISGCSPASEGCANCYAERVAKLFKLPWGKPVFHPEKLDEPLRTKKPGKVFVCSMSDLFHEDVNTEWILQIWTTMLKAPQHTFIVLTKRADRMHYILSELYSQNPYLPTPLPNVWLGVTVEKQEYDWRIGYLIKTPAEKIFISYEPGLGPLKLDNLQGGIIRDHQFNNILTVEKYWTYIESLDWVICGGESGANARPMHPEWVRSLRDQCKAAGVPFFFKQWGEWRKPLEGEEYDTSKGRAGNPPSFIVAPNGGVHCFQSEQTQGGITMIRVGKKNAGHLLDGKEHREWPI